MDLVVGQVVLRVETPEPYSPIWGGEPEFMAPGGEPDLVLEIRAAEHPVVPPEARLLFDGLPLWTAHELEGRVWLALWSRDEAPDRAVEVDPRTWRGVVHAAPEAVGSDLNLTTRAVRHPLLLLLAAWRLVYKGGLMIHACGVTWEGHGLCFCGRSESGKTTTSGLWREEPGAVVLNDDRVAVIPEGEGFRIEGTPWYGNGEICANAGAPLELALFLRHGRENALRELSPAQAYGELYAAALLPYYDPTAMALGMDTLERLAGAVTCRQFDFLPDHSAVAHVQEYLRARPERTP